MSICLHLNFLARGWGIRHLHTQKSIVSRQVFSKNNPKLHSIDTIYRYLSHRQCKH